MTTKNAWKNCRISNLPKRWIGFASLCLMISGCCSAAAPQPVTVTEVKLEPPTVLMQPCIDPVIGDVKTNADLVRVLSLYMEAFDICKAKHEALVAAIQEGE